MAYEDQSLSGSWYKSGLFVADTWTESWEQIFEGGEHLLGTTYMAPPWISNYLFFHNPPYNGTDRGPFAAALRGAWPGSALIHYSGHSGISSLGNHHAFLTSYPSRNCSRRHVPEFGRGPAPLIDLAPATLFAPLLFREQQLLQLSLRRAGYTGADEGAGDATRPRHHRLLRVLDHRLARRGVHFADAFFKMAFGRARCGPWATSWKPGVLPYLRRRPLGHGHILLGDLSLDLRLPAPHPTASWTPRRRTAPRCCPWDSPPGNGRALRASTAPKMAAKLGVGGQPRFR